MEQLVIINGVEIVDDDDMKIQVVFDGETVTFRHEDGTIQSMGTLCYLHFILVHFIDQLTEDGMMLSTSGITPGHVLSHVIDHLHEQHHALAVGESMSAFAQMMSGHDDKDMVVMKVGKNGLEKIPLSELPNEIAKMKGRAESNEATSDTESDEDEIIVHGTQHDPKKYH